MSAWIGNIIAILIPILASFLLTAFVGNRLLQRWQQRAWLQQQAVLQGHNEIDQAKRTIDNLVNLAGARNYRARKLLRSLRVSSDEELREIRCEYDKAVSSWNEQLNSFQVNLTIYSEYRFSERIEDVIQPKFVEVSSSIASILATPKGEQRTKRLQMQAPEIEWQLNQLNGSLFEFSRDVIKQLVDRQRAIYVGRPVSFSVETIELFSTWYLFKALFQADHLPQSIFSAPFHASAPSAIRN